jgi:RNA-directed DNA polymerase
MAPHIIDYRKAETLEDVAKFLNLECSLLEEVIAAGRAPDTPQSVYIRHRIPKRRGAGQVRIVWDISSAQIRDAHRAFAWRFEHFAQDVVSNFPHPCAYGYVRRRGIKDNASQHLGAKLLLRFDLHNFFSTISFDRLVGRFVQMGIQLVPARVLAGFATIESKLALGLNASPMLANLVCSALDEKLQKLAEAYRSRYTRYADDISISGDRVPSGGEIAEIIESEGFQLSTGKSRLTRLGQAHFVTGLSVSDFRAAHVPRQFKHRLRQELHYCTRFGIRSHLSKVAADRSYQKGVNWIDGSVRFISSIEPQLGLLLRDTWRKSLAAESASVSYSPVHDRAGANAHFLVDESEWERNGKRYLAVACVTTEQVDVIRAHVMTTLRKHLIDPFAPGRKKALAARGLHFSDAPEVLRTEYIDFLPLLQFRTYIGFGELTSSEAYTALYLKLLSSLLVQRFRGYDRGIVSIHIEQNDHVSESALQDLIRQTYEDLEQRNERRPIALPAAASKAKKDEPAFSLADCMLWVFSRTFDVQDGVGEIDYLRFERLRDKYRHIVNVDTLEVFSRRHPVEIRRRPGVRES